MTITNDSIKKKGKKMAYLWSYFPHFERKIRTKMSETG